MVTVVVEAHAGGRLLRGAHRDQQLELQRLLDLGVRHDLAAAAEERVARLLDAIGQAEAIRDLRRPRHPALTEVADLRRRADADIFPHAEALQSVEILRGLVAEAIARHVEQQAACRHVPAARRQRIDRIASGRAQHQIGWLQRRGPVLAGLELRDHGANVALAAMQAAHTAEEMRKALEIARLLQLLAAHDRRKSQDLGARLAMAGDQPGEALDHLLVERRAGIDAVGAHRPEQGLRDRIDAFALLGRSLECNVHLDVPPAILLPQSRKASGTAFNIEAVATFARMRSLLIMIGDDSTSRRWRPTLNSLSLR